MAQAVSSSVMPKGVEHLVAVICLYGNRGVEFSDAERR